MDFLSGVGLFRLLWMQYINMDGFLVGHKFCYGCNINSNLRMKGVVKWH